MSGGGGLEIAAHFENMKVPTQTVKFTCRELLDQEKRPQTEDSPKGADPAKAGKVVVDETGETVAPCSAEAATRRRIWRRS